MISLLMPKLKHFDIDDRFFFKGANAIIVIKSTDTVDGALAAATMELTAQVFGLGVLYSGFFTRAANMSRKLKCKLAFAKGEKAVMTLVLGYPDMKYHRIPQRETPSVVYD
jgi:nitroreductase